MRPPIAPEATARTAACRVSHSVPARASGTGSLGDRSARRRRQTWLRSTPTVRGRSPWHQRPHERRNRMPCEIASPSSRAPPGAPDEGSPARSARPAPPSSAPDAPAAPARLRSDYDRAPRPSRRRPSWSPPWAARASPCRSTTSTRCRCAALADRLRADHGRIDVLVNDIWGGEVLKGGPPDWNKPIWEHDLDDGLRILRLGIDTHLITAHPLLPLVVGGTGRAARRGHRRHPALQRRPLPDLGVLRPRQGRR